MTVKDLIKKKDYDYISWRMNASKCLNVSSIFFGVYRSENGKLIPLGGDSHCENEIVLEYEEWTNGDKNGLTVLID